MSISGILGHTATQQWARQAGTTASGSAAASGATDAIANTGSVSAGNMAAFYQSFSADLQSMLSQSGQGASPATTPRTSQTAANQPVAAPHHHRHHHPSQGDGRSLSADANQPTSAIGRSTNSGSLTPNGISNSASIFAADVMQALQAYGASAASPPATGPVV